ncbi:MAG TPA: bifunctional serine/threonine-protein kinase/ABC transporter substrate-binding protein [Ktedonobacteraceae bacterium]|nr:bifunctional serine/threonine-protein kinase/ABC transporter substrate-binding protein [Ktedonobacteraceae bacterium]
MALNQAATSGTIPATPAASTTGGTRTGGNSRSLTPGSRLQGGRYVIKRVLGQGGMGAALLATDLRLDSKPVVIKELISDNTDPAQLQDDVRNFKREVATLAHLDHPLIPNVTDHFQEGSRYFMVQEYVEGENLEERMDRLNQPMKEREALGYASEVLDILDYLSHETPPIVHRDIKPANIIIGNKDKRAHLVDFGIARADETRNARRKQTSALGTPGYAPPEQYQGNADPRSDLYALAATLHHVLTNRDPRNHPPFSYPPARTLNPQLSPETEQMLKKAVTNDINQRYQSAAAMKQDVDNILLNKFGISGNTSSYTLGTSGPINAASSGAPTIASTGQNQPTIRSSQAQQQRPPQQRPQQQPANIPPPPPPIPVGGGYGTPYTPGGMGQPPQPQQRRSNVGRNFLLLIIILLLIFGALYFALPYIRNLNGTATGGSTPGVTPATTSNGIGVTKAPDGEYIGISDGTFAFDSSVPRSDGELKTQAAARIKAGDTSGAIALLNQAITTDTNDAEAHIYLEDQKVLASGSPYVTFVVATMATGSNNGVGRDNLQGAYIAQSEFNGGAKLGNVKVRLLIANSGNDSSYATTVANQIVQLAQSDKTFAGVMGWPFSSRTLNAVSVLARAHIPMVSQTASSDQLTGISPYFFRVAPADKAQAQAGVTYVEQKLHARNVAVFVDTSDPYSQSLANGFSSKFTADGNTIAVTEHYTEGNAGTVSSALQDALKHNPDLIYFAGYATDVSVLLTDLPTSGQFANLKVMGGDGLYELGGYPTSARSGFGRLNFTAFAYPDEWAAQGLASQQPAFFSDYANAYDPNKAHSNQPYGYSRADNDAILSYDGMLAILNASKMALSGGKTTMTPDNLQQALSKLNGTNAFQGVSGQIALGPDGNPINKAVVVLFVDSNDHIQLVSIAGTFRCQQCQS